MTVLTKATVALWATSQVAFDGVDTWFSERAGFACLPFGERRDADVLLFLAPGAADRAIAAMTVRPGDPGPPSVLVSDRLSPRQAAQATDRGMVQFLDHAVADMSEVADALGAAVAGTERPYAATSFARVGARADSSYSADEGGTGMSPREIEVLRHLAAGATIAEIGARLNYSERTIKTIVHGVVSRLGFRNRLQAVVYGIRMGML